MTRLTNILKPRRLTCVAMLALFFPAIPAFPAADHFYFTLAPWGQSHIVNEQAVFTVEARNPDESLDSGFNQSVTVGLYDNNTPGSPLADPLAVITSGGVTVGIGTAVLSFVNGQLSFQLVFQTGIDSEYLVIWHPTIATGNTPGLSYRVKGFTVTYYPQFAGGNPPLAVYPPNTDLLDSDPSVASSGTTVTQDIPYSSDGSSSAVFVAKGLIGRYAAGGADLTSNIMVRKKSGYSGNTGIRYRMILDYDGTLPATGGPNNYVSPRTTDTVYQLSSPYSAYGVFDPAPQASWVPGSASIGPSVVMNNGQAVLMVWNTSSSTPAELLLKTPASPVSQFASNITVPFSDKNISPVQASLTPKQILISAPVTMYYGISNYSGLPVSLTVFKIPANPGGTGSSWALSATPTTRAGGTVTYLNPSGSTDGAVTIDWGSAPVATGENVSVTLVMGSASSTIHSDWDFGLITVKSAAGNDLISDSLGAQNIETLGKPSTPSFISAAAADYTGAGNQVDLSWGQVTDNSANGYVLSRRSPAGSGAFSAFLTIGPSASAASITSVSDTSAVNLSAYDYTVEAANPVSKSDPVTTTSPVTPFANPGPPTAFSARTSGTTVRLNWTAPVSVTGSFAPGGYYVYRGTTSNGETSFAQIPAVTTWDDTSVSAGTTYFYKIASVDSQPVTGTPGTGAHISGYTSEAYGFPPGNPPFAPDAVLLSSSPATIQFSWDVPIGCLYAPVSYIVDRAVTTGTYTSPYTVVVSSTISLFDTSVANGLYYRYRVAAIDSQGVTSNYTDAVTGRVGPSAPVSFRASSSASAVTLAWNANPTPEMVQSYVVYRNSAQIANPASTTTAVTNTTSLVQGTDYLYEVEAVDNAGVTGPRSSLTSALLPNTPASFGVTANAVVRSNVDMAWTTPPSGGNVTGYNIYRNTIPSIPATPIATPTVTLAFQDTSLSSANAGTTYFYFLQAQNRGGAGPTTVTALQIPPNPPSGVGVSSTSATITVNWAARPTPENVSRYSVYRIALPTGTPTVVGMATPGTAITYNDGTAQTGMDYAYYVTAFNPGFGPTISGGESLASVSITYGRRPQVPGGFAMGVALSAPDSSTVTFTWAAVTVVDPNAVAAVVYENGAAAATLSASTTLYINSSASADVTYTYNLAVTNAYGAGSTAVTPASRLTYPTTVTLNPITLLPNNVYMATSWTTIGSTDVTGYRVYRSLNGGAYSLVQTIPAAGLAFPITFTYPVQHGQEYSFEITAVNATGEGMRSNPQTVRTGPSIPAGLTAVSGASTSSLGVSLCWHLNPTAEGVGTYTVYRSQTAGTLGSYVSLGTTSDPVTVYDDSSSLTDKAVYYYLVSASGAGLESYLNTVNAVAVTAYLAPNVPAPPTADPANASATITWTVVAATSYPVTGYNLVRTGPSGVTQVNSAPITGLSYLDTGLTNGVTYSYELQARDDQGHLSALSSPVSVEPLAPPGVPANFTGGAGDNAIQLSWDSTALGTLPLGGYLLYRRDLPSGPVSLILQAPATTVAYVDTNGGVGLAAGVTYNYWLQAVDSSGVTTGLHIGSSSVTVTLSATGHVNPPGNIIAAASPGSVNLTWNDSFAPGSYPVTGYQLMRAATQAGPYSVLANPVTAASNPNSYLDTGSGVVNGTRYYYYFVARDTIGQSSINSVTVTAMPARPPDPPTGVTAIDGVSQVSLAWNAAVTVDNVPVSAYLVYRAILPAAPAIVATLLSPAVTFTDAGLSVPATIQYCLGVININGTAGTSQSTTVTSYPYTEFTPAGLSSVASNTAVTLTWTPNGSPAYPVTGFSVTRTDLSGASVTILPAASSPYADVIATAGTLYVYRVQAVDEHGHLSALSSPVTDGPANPPAAPAPFMIFAGASQNLLDWGAAVPATPGGLPVSLYVLVGSNGVSVVLPATQTWYLDGTAVDGSPVTYTLTAIDESGRTTAGVHVSPAAGPVSATASASNVNPPTGLAATATAPTSMLLTWVPSNDQGRVIDFYTVFRAPSLAVLYSSPTSIARVDNPALSPATQFVDTGVSADTDYYYMLRATDSINALESSNSNHAWARTPRPLRPVPPVTSGVMAFDANLFKPLEGGDLAIYFILPTAGSVEIDIYNVAGRHVQYLYLGTRPAGVQQSVLWDGKDHGGNVVASGIYLIEIKAPGFHQVKKVAVVK